MEPYYYVTIRRTLFFPSATFWTITSPCNYVSFKLQLSLLHNFHPQTYTKPFFRAKNECLLYVTMYALFFFSTTVLQRLPPDTALFTNKPTLVGTNCLFVFTPAVCHTCVRVCIIVIFYAFQCCGLFFLYWNVNTNCHSRTCTCF